MNVLWIPIFSMRSYETGQYSILKDGNFQLTMARALASDYNHITMVVPEDSSDYADFLYNVRNLTKGRFTTLKLKYGMNAVETREQFWDLNRDELVDRIDGLQQFDLIISDVTDCPYRPYHPVPIIYNFNITKLPELDRPYIDKFFEKDLNSIEQSVFTSVINPRQREYILEVRPDLIEKVFAHFKVAHESLLPKHNPPTEEWSRNIKKIFWPFRISDKAYQFEQFIEAFDKQGLAEQGYTIDVTDPNDTLKITRPYLRKIKLSKAEYYMMMANRFTVVMLDDIDTVLHPGTIEFLHYGCPTITYKSKLVDNPNAIGHLDELSEVLANLAYNRFDTSPFVYAEGEIDIFYNNLIANVLKN